MAPVCSFPPSREHREEQRPEAGRKHLLEGHSFGCLHQSRVSSHRRVGIVPRERGCARTGSSSGDAGLCGGSPGAPGHQDLR